MSLDNTHEHRPANWEFNPITMNYTKRCVVCGDILRRHSLEEAKERKIPALMEDIKRVLANKQIGGSGG